MIKLINFSETNIIKKFRCIFVIRFGLLKRSTMKLVFMIIIIASTLCTIEINCSENVVPLNIVTTMEKRSITNDKELIEPMQAGETFFPFQVLIEVRALGNMQRIYFGGSIISDRSIVSSYTMMTNRQPGSQIWFLFGSDNRQTLTRFISSSGFSSVHGIKNLGIIILYYF